MLQVQKFLIYALVTLISSSFNEVIRNNNTERSDGNSPPTTRSPITLNDTFHVFENLQILFSIANANEK